MISQKNKNNQPAFTCNNCNYKSVKWLGCCPECKEWDSFVEKQPVFSSSSSGSLELYNLDNVKSVKEDRMCSGIKEWDQVLGGGIVPGSFLILTGDPGIGKSTLLMQISNNLAQNYKVFYFSSEESLEQVKNRALRLGAINKNLLFGDQANLESIIEISKEKKPDLILIDSIQNCYMSQTQALPGTIAQLRESAYHLMRLAKENNITVILSGHITKEGSMAGPKTLEHMVDGVFYLKGEDRWQTRILRAIKNRFGTINEIGFFEMRENGMVEVPNINQQLLRDTDNSPGSVLISYIEGSRPLLIELQALTITSKFGMPQRVVTGMDPKQVILIAAILEKYLQIKLSSNDIFFKISGGFKIKDNSSDLGVALALLSSYFQKPLPEKSIALGEISLTGQIKPINRILTHLNEAKKFGIEHFFISKNQKINDNTDTTKFKNVYELLSLF